MTMTMIFWQRFIGMMPMLWCFFLSSHYSWRHKCFLYILLHGAKVGYRPIIFTESVRKSADPHVCILPMAMANNSYWTTRIYANSRIANSRTGQLVDATGDCMLSFRSFGGICETASCPVHNLSSPRVVESASWRIRELSSYLCNSDDLECPWRSFPYCKPAHCLSGVLL